VVTVHQKEHLLERRETAFLKDLRVVVVGLGVSGEAAAKLAAGAGAEVWGLDRKLRHELGAKADELESEGVNLLLGDNPIWKDFDLVVMSPGVPDNHPIVQTAKEEGIPVWSEIEFASRCARCHLIAVTGTDGKTTTVTMVRDILSAHRKRAFLGGNIGTAFSSLVGDKHFVHTPFAVVEVSSFQLLHVDSFKPHVVAILNIAVDHRDRHGSQEAYREAKWRIIKNMDEYGFLVVRNDLANEIPDDFPGYPLFFGLKDEGREGTFWVGDRIFWRFENEVVSLPVAPTYLSARPEKENAAAAVTIAMAAGMELHKSVAVVEKFKPLPHRLECVGRKGGITFVNNSKSTNVHSTLAALESIQSPVVLIAGGKDKGEDFDRLVEATRGRLRAAVLLGETANRLAAHLADVTHVRLVGGMEEAVTCASEIAQDGDTVLLSPACSSFDMYSGFEERGEDFRRLVSARV